MKSCNSFRFSAHPDDLIKPLCRVLIGHALDSLTVRILETNLKGIDPMVIGCQLLMSFLRSGKVDLDINTVRHSFTTSGITPVASH